MNFEMSSPLEMQISREMEKIELAHAKMVERFEGQVDCLAFVDYLKTTEKIFTEAKYRKWDAEKSKEKLVKIEIDIISQKSKLPAEFFSAINDAFKRSCISIGKICDITDQMLEKYKDNKDCCEFIQYLSGIYVNFDNIRRGGMEIIDLKNSLARAKMQVLSSDGEPEYKMLEGVYQEFRTLLK